LAGELLSYAAAYPALECAPPDLVVLAPATFLDCDVLSFKLKAINVHDEVDDDAQAMSWDGVVRTLKTK
jgi:hypothetical protein